jgi:hypothetical protein
MAFKFNPFTGTLDQTGSGGGASYIDGEVQNFSALPETIGTPAVDSSLPRPRGRRHLALARKPAGIYIRTADTGVRAADWTHASAFPDVFSDAAFTVYSDGDSTKNLQLSLSGLTTGTTRTLTAPDASGTIALTSDFASPPAIGSTTPNSGAFTTLSATGTTELVNGGTTAGPFRLYNTFTDASNYERGFMRWDSNNFDIGCEAAGTGTLRNVRIKTNATSGVSGAGYIEFGGSGIINTIKSVGGTANGALYIYSQSTLRMLIGGSSGTQFYQLIFPSGNGALDIGRTGNRWRDVFCRSVDLTGDLILTTATGTKIGTATTQKLGFFNATPVVQQAAIADATDAATAITQLNDLLAAMRTLGLIAT